MGLLTEHYVMKSNKIGHSMSAVEGIHLNIYHLFRWNLKKKQAKKKPHTKKNQREEQKRNREKKKHRNAFLKKTSVNLWEKQCHETRLEEKNERKSKIDNKNKIGKMRNHW